MDTKTCITHSGNATFLDSNSECLCKRTQEEGPYSRFFAKTHVFLSYPVLSKIEKSISLLEKIIKSEDFKKLVFKEVNDSRVDENVEGGILMSYDFHIDGDMPKLIEINTNAGGAFLNYELAKITQGCCGKLPANNVENFEREIITMFRNEFAKKSDKKLETVCILDDNPEKQFLYPEFLICKDILERNGIKTWITDPRHIVVENDKATLDGVAIDFIYNRLTDFYFEEEGNTKFLSLLDSNVTVISPSPDDHRLFADKINFMYLQELRKEGGPLVEEERESLKNIIPETTIVNNLNEESLWTHRKNYFFKPYNGFGGGGAYNGKGLTKRVWGNIIQGNYIAQEIIAPSLRVAGNEEEKEIYKFDIRAYTYRGKVLLLATRMYQGQTTNFRTEGGGFAPILITEK